MVVMLLHDLAALLLSSTENIQLDIMLSFLCPCAGQPSYAQCASGTLRNEMMPSGNLSPGPSKRFDLQGMINNS